jgi:hypothetical protein
VRGSQIGGVRQGGVFVPGGERVAAGEAEPYGGLGQGLAAGREGS